MMGLILFNIILVNNIRGGCQQVELYAEYDHKMLLPFLRNSQHYKLEKVYSISGLLKFSIILWSIILQS